jgi:hypothetical protein
MAKMYKIYAALHSESRTGKVWNNEKLNNRLIKIINVENNKSVIVSNRRIDSNFEKKYNDNPRFTLEESALVIDEFYRNKLGVFSTQEIKVLTINPVAKWQICDNLRYLYEHPDDVVRITFWLAIISIGLSIGPLIFDFIFDKNTISIHFCNFLKIFISFG